MSKSRSTILIDIFLEVVKGSLCGGGAALRYATRAHSHAFIVTYFVRRLDSPVIEVPVIVPRVH